MFSHCNDLLHTLSQRLTQRKQTLSTAESCTGGLLAAALTDVAGSSAYFRYGFVSYANEAKTDLLGVDAAILQQYGAVSSETVQAMAQGALQQAKADFALSISGVAGPGGGSKEKPVGTVWFALADEKGVQSKKCCFTGNRQEVRQQAVYFALNWLCEYTE